MKVASTLRERSCVAVCGDTAGRSVVDTDVDVAVVDCVREGAAFELRDEELFSACGGSFEDEGTGRVGEGGGVSERWKSCCDGR